MNSIRHYGRSVAAPVRSVRTDDGIDIAMHVLREPDGNAPPIVMVHALAMDGRMWTDVADALPPATNGGGIFAIDCRGHGLSSDAPAPFTTARFADDIACVLDALGAPVAHVVGCSMGGTVTLAFAGRHPGRAASLTVIDSTAWYGPEAPEAWESRAQKAIEGGMQALTEFQRARWFSPSFVDANPVLVQEAVDLFLRNRVPCYVATCRMLGAADERAGLERIDCPANVVVGEDDYATPVAMSEAIAAALPDARLTVLPALRHYTPLEAPAAIAALIANSIERSTAGDTP